MSECSPTLRSLAALGFERVSGGAAESVRYEFKNFQLSASSVMWWTGKMVMLSGSDHTGRSPLVMDPGDLSSAKVIPNDLGIAEAAAWVSFMLQSLRRDIGPLPEWFVEGEGNWDLVYERMDPEGWRKRQAYRDCPKCFIDREYARPLRRNLRDEFAWLSGEAEMTLSFDGRVLSIVLNGRDHEVIASGDSWPSSYRATVSQEAQLPNRFQSGTVEVSILEGYVSFDRVRLGPCEPVE